MAKQAAADLKFAVQALRDRNLCLAFKVNHPAKDNLTRIVDKQHQFNPKVGKGHIGKVGINIARFTTANEFVCVIPRRPIAHSYIHHCDLVIQSRQKAGNILCCAFFFSDNCVL